MRFLYAFVAAAALLLPALAPAEAVNPVKGVQFAWDITR